ncbi:MAG: hypothetical protein H3C36_12510 [Chitinophagaceae bacterium]|nr:hypothetical protein [Chitinophagaceae bacterium]MCW5915587.1 hypothetical protein [Chitinophagaceae bacterium]MCZ2397501.1 DUF5683 domain-containing protein [Chitinophagales bacterium]
MVKLSSILIILLACTSGNPLYAQEKTDTLLRSAQDSTLLNAPNQKEESIKGADTTSVKKFSPRKATIRSAILPGWGQAYNKKYWKIPIVYGALGTSAGFFFYNLNTYKGLKQSVIYRLDNDPSNDNLVPARFSHLSTEALIFYRNSFRRDIDYSVLAFILLWGLNVVDATVDAHLKGFDVSPNLSMKLKPHFSSETNTAGLSLVFTLHRKNNRFDLN